MRRAGREVAIGLGAYAAYLAARHVVWNDRGRDRARRNAARIADAERRAGVFVERYVQRAAARTPRLVTIFNAGYAVGNVTLSVGWLFALYRRGSPAYARERRAAVAAFLAAVPVFATFPTAPPRSLDGFIDTLRARGIDLDHPVLVRLYNPIAAMPSYHMAFAVVTGLGVANHGRSRAVRLAGRAYPVAVAAVVIGTGNHFVADVAAGSALGAVARAVTR